MDIVVATNNKGKLKELGEMLTGFNILSQQDVGAFVDVDETGTTYEENAFLKAEAVRAYTDKYIIADDSGLEVDVLDGAPGLYSARYAGDGTTPDQGMQKLLENLAPYAPQEKTAHFVSCIVLLAPDGTKHSFYGRCDGLITDRKLGDGGFGFDPIFWFEEFGKTFAQLTPEQKNSVSHRHKALCKLKEYLEKI